MTDTIATYLLMLLRMSIQIQAQGVHLCRFRYYQDFGHVCVDLYPHGAGSGEDSHWLLHTKTGEPIVQILSTARIGRRDSVSRTFPATEEAVLACLERAATELRGYVSGSISDPIREARHAA